jgi:hypothetical protein
MNFFRSTSEENIREISETLTKLFSSAATEIPSSLASLELESWKPIQTENNIILDMISFWNDKILLKREIMPLSTLDQLSCFNPFNGKMNIYCPMNKTETFEVIIHYRSTKSIILSNDMLIEELKNQISKLFQVAISMVRLQIRNGQDLMEGYVREYNLKKGDELMLIVNRLPRVPVSFCCTFLNPKLLKEEANSKEAIVVPILFQDSQTKRVENLLLFCHPDLSVEKLIEMVRTELDAGYFSTLSSAERKKLNPNLMSKPALLNLTRAICHSSKDEERVVEIPQEILRKALQEEHQMRTCPETQSRFSQAEKSNDKDWLFVAEDFQRMIAEKYCKECENVSADDFLSALRYQSSEFLPLWKKYNRARRGFLNLGSIAPDCPLWNIEKQSYCWLSDVTASKSLSTSLNQNKKKTITIIVAGSYS